MKENDKKEYKNWYKTLKRIQKKELILFGVLILLAFIFVGISETAYEWFKIIKIYSVLDNKPLINIPICIIISGFAIWWWTKIWKDKDIRPYRLGIVAFGLIVFIFINGFQYANIVCNFSYKCFFIGLFSLLFIVSLIKIFATCEITWAQNLIKWKFKIFKKLIVRIEIFWKNKGKIKDKKNDNKTELKGFSVDNTEIKLEDNQIKYAETLVKKLKNTDLSKESFAVGITGEWGSGKSTFLNTMKKEIKKEDFAEIVEFNPWLCNSPEQVTQDFFATLINELSPKHSTLSRDINKYAKLLNKIAKPSLSIFGIDLDLTPGDDSLDELKENISKKLAKLPKKVVILIDDTDRLEGNEVFEILRLIRNTADFKNVIYIATYDKEYVTDVLKGNKIKDPDNYLEKIFQTEVHLLKVEGYELWDMLKEEIIEQSSNPIDIHTIELIDEYFFEEKEFILRILNNYRKVKRFARQYMFYLDYVNKELNRNISILDLFWLELLEILDKSTYDILAKDPNKLLEKKGNQFNLRKDIPSDVKNNLVFKDENRFNILEKMFTKSDSELQNQALSKFIKIKNYNYTGHLYRIRDTKCYDYYFSFNQSRKILYLNEYLKIIDYSIDKYVNNYTRIKYIEDKIQIWLNQDKKHFESILKQFKSNIPDLKNAFSLRNYIYSLLSIGLEVVSTGHVYEHKFYELSLLLKKEAYDQDDFATLNDIVKEYFQEKTKYNTYDEILLTNLSKLLNLIHDIQSHYFSTFISNETIEELLNELLSKYLQKNKDSKVNDIMNPDTDLAKIFYNCFLYDKENYKQIAFSTVIEHFAPRWYRNSLERPPISDYEESIKELRRLSDFDSRPNNSYKAHYKMWDFLEKEQANDIKKFKEQCFTHN
ncbi:MAG: P-loop NTPase fold protein [Bacteroidales bacterium]|nr:P-loop NTPase fold protein [Bacteroidales bacterium]